MIMASILKTDTTMVCNRSIANVNRFAEILHHLPSPSPPPPFPTQNHLTQRKPSRNNGLLCNVVQISTQEFCPLNIIRPVKLLINGVGSVSGASHG